MSKIFEPLSVSLECASVRIALNNVPRMKGRLLSRVFLAWLREILQRACASRRICFYANREAKRSDFGCRITNAA